MGGKSTFKGHQIKIAFLAAGSLAASFVFHSFTEIITAHHTEEDHELMIDIIREVEDASNKTEEEG